jgi:hypothetical protein
MEEFGIRIVQAIVYWLLMSALVIKKSSEVPLVGAHRFAAMLSAIAFIIVPHKPNQNSIDFYAVVILNIIMLYMAGFAISYFRRQYKLKKELKAGSSSNKRISTQAEPNTHASLVKVSATANEDALWEQAAKEVDSSDRKLGLWAKCFAGTNGDENKAKAEYLKQRVAELTAETQEDAAKKRELMKQAFLNETQNSWKAAAARGTPTSCPKCDGLITTKTDRCQHCQTWLGMASNQKPTPP